MPRKQTRKKASKQDRFDKQQLALAKKMEVEQRLSTEEDYIFSKRHGNSLAALIEGHPDGVPESVIIRVLHLSRFELAKIWAKILKKLGNGMGKNELRDMD